MDGIDERRVEEEAQRALAEGLAVDLFTARMIARMNHERLLAERQRKEAENGAQQPRADDARRG